MDSDEKRRKKTLFRTKNKDGKYVNLLISRTLTIEREKRGLKEVEEVSNSFDLFLPLDCLYDRAPSLRAEVVTLVAFYQKGYSSSSSSNSV